MCQYLRNALQGGFNNTILFQKKSAPLKKRYKFVIRFLQATKWFRSREKKDFFPRHYHNCFSEVMQPLENNEANLTNDPVSKRTIIKQIQCIGQLSERTIAFQFRAKLIQLHAIAKNEAIDGNGIRFRCLPQTKRNQRKRCGWRVRQAVIITMQMNLGRPFQSGGSIHFIERRHPKRNF